MDKGQNGRRKGTRVLVVGSAEQSAGGVASAIRLMKRMPVWKEYRCYWLGTQIQRSKLWKLWYAVKAYFIAFFIIWRFDIVHFHTVPNVSMKIQLPIFLLAKLWHKKIVLHLHAGNQLTMVECVNFHLAHWCMRKSDRIVLLAHRFKKFLNEYWKDVKTPCTIVYNACEKVDALPYGQHQKNILFCGRFTNNKSAETLIEAFGMIHDKFPNWKLQFLAQGPEEEKCRQLVKDFQMEKQVEMPGFKTGEEKAAYYRSAGIFCLCSHYEGFPMVVLEAWAYGVPVVTTPVGALPDFVQEGKNGYLYEIEDVDTLAILLEKLMNDDDLRSQMSIYSENYVEANFSVEAVNRQLQDLYHNL